jgi:septum formation protein
MLEAAGLAFKAEAPDLDEVATKAKLRADGLSAHDQAVALAALKAISVSRRSQAYVIGADQMLAVEGQTLDKPKDLAEARTHLQKLRGNAHHLITAVAVAREGEVIWRHIDTPRLEMRAFSEAFLDDYLQQAGEGALSSVGAYQLEGLGAQLFERVEGDYFSVLGLPLLPLLSFLREHGMAPT